MFYDAKLALLILAVAIFYSIRTIYRLFFHPLARIPGPWYLAASTVPGAYYMCLSGKWHIINKLLHEKYGPIIRVGPNKISVKGEIGWKEVYGPKGHGNAEWAKWPEFFSGVPKDITSAPTPDHRRMRRQIIRAFSEKAIQEQQPTIKQYSQRFISIMRARDQTVVDISKWLNFFLFDMFGDLAFGEPFGSLEGEEYHPWVALVVETVKMTKMVRFLDEAPWLNYLVKALTPANLKRQALEYHHISARKIKQRIEQGDNSRKDFMSYIWGSDTEKLITQEELENNAGTLIAAASETTVTTLTGLMYYLMKNPEKYARLMNEVRSTFPGSDEEVTLQSSSKLAYLQACLEEGLRLFPPVPIGATRQVPSEGAHLEGYYLPGKTLVEVPQWATHRAADNFCDPESFAPERWLSSDHPLFVQRYQHDNRNVAQPFSFGPRNCAGKALAYYEMRFILCLFFKNFDIELHPSSEEWVERCENYFLWHKPELFVKIRARSK